MKLFHLLLVALFTCTLSLATFADNSYAASATKAGTAVTDTANTAKTAISAVNINTADKALLTQIPGIGPVTADAILQYRKDNGQFKSLDELTKVKGIGDKSLAKFKPYLQTI